MSSIESYGYVLIKSDESLDELGCRIRTILNVAATNRDPVSRDQRRFGLNFGGDYFKFDVMGVIVHLMQNRGESSIGRESEWPYYVWIDPWIDPDEVGWSRQRFDEISRAASMLLMHLFAKSGVSAAEAPDVPGGP